MNTLDVQVKIQHQLFSFTLTTSRTTDYCQVVFLSTTHPVLAQAGFDVRDDEYKTLYLTALARDGVVIELGYLSMEVRAAILTAIENHIHDFFFGFYPKVIALPLLNNGYYTQATRYGLPECNTKPFSRKKYQRRDL